MSSKSLEIAEKTLLNTDEHRFLSAGSQEKKQMIKDFLLGEFNG